MDAIMQARGRNLGVILPAFNEVTKAIRARLPGSNVIDGLIQRGSGVRFSWQAIGSRQALHRSAQLTAQSPVDLNQLPVNACSNTDPPGIWVSGIKCKWPCGYRSSAASHIASAPDGRASLTSGRKFTILCPIPVWQSKRRVIAKHALEIHFQLQQHKAVPGQKHRTTMRRIPVTLAWRSKR